MALPVCLGFLSAGRSCFRKTKGRNDEEVQEAATDKKQGAPLASGGGGRLSAEALARGHWETVQKAGLPLGAVSGSASPGPAYVRATLAVRLRPRGLLRAAGTRPQPESVSTQGTRSALHRLVSELESLKGSRGHPSEAPPLGPPLPVEELPCVSALIYLIWQMA